MKRDITVRRYSEKIDSPSAILNLIHAAFSHYLKRGVYSLGSRIDDAMLRQMLDENLTIIAVDVTDAPIGVLFLSGKQDGYIELLAIAPAIKRRGVGRALLSAAEDAIRKRGGKVICSDTSLKMRESRKWHQNNGFKCSSLVSFSSTDYYSIEFRKDLVRRPLGEIRCLAHFCLSCVITMFTKKKGRDNRPNNKLTLNEIQSVSLDILTKVHSFCKENGIKYSLAYGSLIGAIRHNGFIPWDDDVDIIMPRQDYERFKESFNCPGLGLLSEDDPNSYVCFSRVYDYSRTFNKTTLPFAHNYYGGVWIDIFAADGVPDNFSEFQALVARQTALSLDQLYYRDPKAELSVMPTLKKKVGLLSRKILRLNGWPLKSVNKKMLSNMQGIPFGDTNHWSQLACMDDGDRMYQLTEDFKDVECHSFEGREVYIMTGYDRVLRTLYGDYMQLPPEEERIPKQSFLSFYWIR